jgi:hypothetical protein
MWHPILVNPLVSFFDIQWLWTTWVSDEQIERSFNYPISFPMSRLCTYVSAYNFSTSANVWYATTYSGTSSGGIVRRGGSTPSGSNSTPLIFAIGY